MGTFVGMRPSLLIRLCQLRSNRSKMRSRVNLLTNSSLSLLLSSLRALTFYYNQSGPEGQIRNADVQALFSHKIVFILYFEKHISVRIQLFLWYLFTFCTFHSAEHRVCPLIIVLWFSITSHLCKHQRLCKLQMSQAKCSTIPPNKFMLERVENPVLGDARDSRKP